MTYFRYLLRHKWYVFWNCLRLAWLGVIHDSSKLSRTEFWAFRRWGAGGREWEDGYARAWLHHQHKGKHQWKYWVLIHEDGRIEPLEIPEPYRSEMLADWRSAARCQGDDLRQWYIQNRSHVLLHPATRRWIEKQLEAKA